MSARALSPRRYRAWPGSTALLVAVGVAMSLAGAQLVASNEAENSREGFHSTSREVASTLRLAIEHEEDLIVSAGAYFAANPRASGIDFTAWTLSMHALARYPELQAIGLATIVPRAQVPAFEAQTLADRLTTAGADHRLKIMPSGDRPFYCLGSAGVARGNAATGTQGVDYCAGKAGVPLLASRDSGNGLYAPLRVGPTTFLSVSTPVYRGGGIPATVAARREAFLGWVGETVAPTVVLERALEGHPHTALAFRYGGGAADVVFRAGSAPRGARSMVIDLHNGWTVRTYAAVAGGGIFDSWNSFLVLIAGLALSFLLGLLNGARRRRGRAQTEQEVLRKSGERLDVLLQNSSDMITVVAVDGTILYQAGSVRSVLGHTPSQLVGTNLTAWAGTEDAPQLLALCRTTETAAAAVDLRHADGSLRACDLRATSLLHHPEWAGVVLNIRDVSDRKQLEIELRLAQKLESVGALAAGIAHEINTPVQYVSSSVEFLEGVFAELMALQDRYSELQRAAADGDVDAALLTQIAAAEESADLDYLRERIPAALHRSREGLERVATIVGAMRVFGHPPTSGTTPVDVNAAIENTAVVAASEYKYVADLTTDLGDIPAVLSNGGDLNQVLINLIVNASHAIAEVVGEDGPRGTIHIRTRVEEDQVVVTIADTGGGIPAEIVERVFDPFFTTKAVGRGTGQGLAIARTIIDRHGGALTFETRPGDGTTFSIRLPLAPVATAAATAA